MRRFAGLIVVLSITTLLVLQTAGLHLHANLETDGLNLHAEHVHSLDPDGHDHSADVDVSIIELGTLWAKLGLMILAAGFLLLTPLVVIRRIRLCPDTVSSPTPFHRWRPPLRAPPYPC